MAADGPRQPDRPAVGRRAFLTLGALGVGAMSLPERAAAALRISPQNLVEVPADKHLSAEFVAALTARGEPTRVTGDGLTRIGMPVGGGVAGQVYLAGDGRLWLWDVDSGPGFRPGGANGGGPHYADPLSVVNPFRNGFAVRISSERAIRALDSTGFDDVSFVGQYPVGRVDYRDADCPLAVSLEALSPFVPTAVADSTIPATYLTYTLRNTGGRTIDVELAGWLDSPVCLDSRQRQPIVLGAEEFRAGPARGVEFAGANGAAADPRDDIVFEDWERDTYGPWTVTGTAFGAGPVTEADLPEYMKRFGPINLTGTRFVTSHLYRGADGDAAKADAARGRLASPEFTVSRRYVRVNVGGGGWVGQTCVNVVVDGTVVASLTGDSREPLTVRSADLGAYEGRTAHIEVVDDRTDGWGHVNCDRIVFSDRPLDPKPYDQLPDGGTFALAALEPGARVVPSIAGADDLDGIFAGRPGPPRVDAPGATLTGSVSVPVRLRPGQSRTVRFALAWYFPRLSGNYAGVDGYAGLRKHYRTRYGSARDVVRHAGRQGARLAERTREWERTWYDDSTLPHWFLERTFAPASTVATMTCQWFDSGRFYADEGIYCCAGTCQHVWAYAHSIARLFPELERSARELGDLGPGFDPDTGQMGFRQEQDRNWAADGQAATILRIYREHQMSEDSSFLRRVWPGTRKAVEFMIGQDGQPDGVLDGHQANTLDQVWFGEVPWLTGLYVAMLHAAAAMATEVGDTDFGGTCRAIAAQGGRHLDTRMFSDEYGYYYSPRDPAHPDNLNANRGCFIDQLHGQEYALQLGLPRVFDKDRTDRALATIFRNNYLPDPYTWAQTHGLPVNPRVYATEGEPGTIMCTWPYGDTEVEGLIGYLDEVWSGQEYQLAAHLIGEGHVTEGLTVTRAVYDRYAAAKRNPYNEVECSDHYARAMNSHAVYLAACGYRYHGPAGALGFAPKITPERFAAAFTAAAGWGVYRQSRDTHRQTSTVEVRYGRLRLREFSTELPAACTSYSVTVLRGGHVLHEVAADRRVDGDRTVLAFRDAVELTEGQSLRVDYRTAGSPG